MAYKKYDAEEILDGTARLMFNVFNTKTGRYNDQYTELMMSGGGGNSLFINCWQKVSFMIDRIRISEQARTCLINDGYISIADADKRNHGYLCNNAKRADNRKKNGKYLHADHNPGNKKVLELIKDKCSSYDPDKTDYEDIIKDLKVFLRTVQTIDWITVEQDDIRTLGDDKYKKKQKDMMTHEERDGLLNDYFYDMDNESIDVRSLKRV